jgi:hypothetical protein
VSFSRRLRRSKSESDLHPSVEFKKQRVFIHKPPVSFNSVVFSYDSNFTFNLKTRNINRKKRSLIPGMFLPEHKIREK